VTADSPMEEGRPERRRARRSGLLAALAVLLLGFVSMTIFASRSRHPADLRGMWTYFSATVGDAVALPIAVGALAAAAALLPRPWARHHRVALIAAALGGVLGAGIQAIWLLDPHPKPNWTLPAAHVFIAAGWWHAAFFVAVLIAVTGMIAHILARISSMPEATGRRDVRSALFTALTAGAAFLTLVAVDSWPSASTPSSAVSIAMSCAGYATAAIGLVVASGGHRRQMTVLVVGSLLTGILLAGLAVVVVTAIS
jgi:MFS family permease